MNGLKTVFKLDAGAKVTAITEETFQETGNSELHMSWKVLHGPSNQPLSVIGQFLHTRAEKLSKQFMWSKDLKTNLIGLPAITTLNLASRVNITEVNNDTKMQYPSLFEGLGNLGEIKTRPNAQPHPLFTAHHVPLPLHAKVKEELQKMEAISQKWMNPHHGAAMVVVPKKNGSVRMCGLEATE